MTDSILTLNAGSSSLKFALFDRAEDRLNPRLHGQIEGIGGDKPRFIVNSAERATLHEQRWPQGSGSDPGPQDVDAALRQLLDWLAAALPNSKIGAVGHRVVHGGPDFAEPLILDDVTLAALRRFVPLAPLHQPYNLAGVEAAQAAFPGALQVACFDTAFHRAHPWVNDTFALPPEYYDAGVRRYGFHGLSYEYLTGELRRIAPYHAAGRVVIAHLGNGASMCAIRDGHSVGSTMGFSALDGLPMGTRCGQIDPGVLLYLMQEKQMDALTLTDLLYRRSGLKGLSGVSHDMRELEVSDAPEAARAIEYFVFRCRRELGAMLAVLNGIDAVVFAGGIGEHAAHVRELICAGFEWLGLELDPHRNRHNETVISSDRSRCRVFVIRTDEEAVIARHTLALLRGAAGG